MTTHLELLRTIVTHTVHERPPRKPLFGEEANWWARAFAFSRPNVSGERIGVRHDGVAAAMKLARSLAKDNPHYHRGARYRTITEAILNASMEMFMGRAPDTIAAADLAELKAAVSAWFSQNIIPRCHVVPCALMPDISGFPHAKPFTIGPVAFSHLSDHLKARNLANLEERALEEIHYQSLLQAMNERHATWVAEVEIDGCELTKSEEIADLAVDIAIVGVQLVIPSYYSRNMARITGRTSPPFVGSVYRSQSHTHGGIHYGRQAGFGLSGGAFDELMSKHADITRSVGQRVSTYVCGGSKLPTIEQAWCDAAYWLHEGLAETLDSIGVAKLETAIEVLLGAESSRNSEKRLSEALHAFFGVKETDPLATDPSVTIKQYVKGIVGPRSRFLHGTWSTLTENAEETRANAERLAFDLLRRTSLALDCYSTSSAPSDASAAFLDWINAEREAGGRDP
jgi:hypothetical protein